MKNVKEEKLTDEIVKEGLRWVVENQGTKCGGTGYGSPRISSEIPDCSMPLTFDQYSFCSMGCYYCFSYFFKANNPSLAEGNVSLKSVNPDAFIKALQGKSRSAEDMRYYRLFYQRKFLLHWGGWADPFCNFEKANGVGHEIMDALGGMNYPTLFSFKGNAIAQPKYMDLFQRYAKQNNFAFQISMITADDNMAKKIEIGVPSPTQRLEIMKSLSDMGYWTILRLRPFVIGITDETLTELLEKALAAGAKGVSAEFYALDVRAKADAKKRYEWMGHLIGVDDLESYFYDLSPSERGGYRRLNRLVKERYVKQIYQFCKKHKLVFGCSDPDFKELNFSGSCCAMPDKYSKNPDMCNWTKNQMTYHLKEARKKFHQTKKDVYLHFSEVYKDEAYFYEQGCLTNDHVIKINFSNADTKALTYEKILRGQWNNLRSPASPVNYLHGKLLPCGLDSEGNIVYRYNPMGYETRWKEEGIDLTG
jgi:DNA repair photolyase